MTREADTFALDIEQHALLSIRDFINEKGARHSVRIELCFTGCCSPSLGLRIDAATETDLVVLLGDVTFIISRDTYELVGDISVSPGDEGKESFVVTSERPVSEWDGFAPCRIKT